MRVFLLLALLAFAPGLAQSASHTTIRFLRDVSSLDRESAARVEDRFFSEAVPAISAQTGARTLTVVPFGLTRVDALRPGRRFVLPAFGRVHVARSRLAEGLHPDIRDQANDAEAAAQAQLGAAHAQAVGQTLVPARRWLADRTPTDFRPSECSSMASLVAACRSSPPEWITVALTDGKESCAPQNRLPVPAEGERRGLTVVVVVPSQHDSSNELEARIELLRRAMPWAIVVRDLPDDWHALLQRLATEVSGH